MSALDHWTTVDHVVPLADGTPVSLRRVRLRDLDALRALAERASVYCEEFELARLVRSDPSERLVLCATALADGGETVLGVGVIELGGWATMPSLVLVDPAADRELASRLAHALIERARTAA